MKHIDPKNITKFDRTLPELERFLIFCICVAGRNSQMVAGKLNKWWVMNATSPTLTLLSFTHDEIIEELQGIKMGQYTRISNALYSVSARVDGPFLRGCQVEDLTSIAGIGPKTARFFLLHSRPNQNLAVLDTHILRYMRENGIADTPKSTPSGKRYLELEKIWLDHCAKCGKTSAQLDLEVWSARAK